MAAKELNTKGGENRFKFSSFAERVQNIDPNVMHRIGSTVPVEPNEGDSYFREALQQWMDLNCTTHFSDFVQDVRGLVQTFPLVLFHKDKIVDILVRHLSVDDTLAYEPLISLTTFLARDLRSEFYPHFGKFIAVFTSLLRTYKDDAKLVESVFHGIGFLFKHLRKELVSDFQQAFRPGRQLLQQIRSHGDHRSRPADRRTGRKVPAGVRRRRRRDRRPRGGRPDPLRSHL